MTKQYIANVVIDNGKKKLAPGNPMPDRFMTVKEREKLIEKGFLTVKEVEDVDQTPPPTDKPTEHPTEPPAGEDSEGTDAGN